MMPAVELAVFLPLRGDPLQISQKTSSAIPAMILSYYRPETHQNFMSKKYHSAGPRRI